MKSNTDKYDMGHICNSTPFKKVALIFVGCIAVIGCGNTADGTLDSVFKGTKDFKRSEIISNGPGTADGVSELTIAVQLTNSDGSPVKFFRPTYDVLSGLGVTASACTESNANGVSTCILKANQAGTKRISFTNITIALQADIIFNNPIPGKPIFGLISASGKKTNTTYDLTATVGSQEPGAIKSSGTYMLYGGVQGEIFSR